MFGITGRREISLFKRKKVVANFLYVILGPTLSLERDKLGSHVNDGGFSVPSAYFALVELQDPICHPSRRTDMVLPLISVSWAPSKVVEFF